MHTGSHRGALVVDGGLQTAATKHYCVSVMDLLSCAEICTDRVYKKMSTLQQFIPSFQNNDVENSLHTQAFE